MSERDVIKRERAAFVAGWLAYQDPTTRDDCNVEAAKRYPLPTITRPRVVTDPHEKGLRWTVRNGQIALYDSDHIVCRSPSNDRVELWADLLANPNETVEE